MNADGVRRLILETLALLYVRQCGGTTTFDREDAALLDRLDVKAKMRRGSFVVWIEDPSRSKIPAHTGVEVDPFDPA